MASKEDNSIPKDGLVGIICRCCKRTFYVKPEKALTQEFCSRECVGGSKKCTREEAFWRHVEKTDGHWVWTGSLGNHDAGGRMSTTVDGKTQNFSVNRLSYEMHRGPIPEGAMIRRTCSNLRCCNPDHLRVHITVIDDKPHKAYLKMTPERIVEIKRLKDAGMAMQDIAARVGADRSVVRRALQSSGYASDRAPRQPKVTLTCKTCGNEFTAVASRDRAQFCSKPCAAKAKECTREEAFWRHTEKSDDCWLWNGALRGGGYAYMGWKENGKHKAMGARIFSYQHHKGPIPDGLVVMHSCDNPKCVNPEHLSVGTQKENVHDAMSKGRLMTNHADRPHKIYAKLTQVQVDEIRCMKISGVKLKDIADKFGTSVSCVYYILRGDTWGD